MCDLVLLHSQGMGIDVHVRTTRQASSSYVSAMAAIIGNHTLEVHKDYYLFDGTLGVPIPRNVSGFSFQVETVHDKDSTVSIASIQVDEITKLEISQGKAMVSVSVFGSNKRFGDATGLLGRLEDGARLARDGVRVLENPIDFGEEWQVIHTDPKLFLTRREPQYPTKCSFTSASRPNLRGGNTNQDNGLNQFCLDMKLANEKEACIASLMSTGPGIWSSTLF